jgi:hypothetical protein
LNCDWAWRAASVFNDNWSPAPNPTPQRRHAVNVTQPTYGGRR